MKVTRILGFTEDEIADLTQAGKILGVLANALGEETADELKVDETALQLIDALKKVLERIG